MSVDALERVMTGENSYNAKPLGVMRISACRGPIFQVVA